MVINPPLLFVGALFFVCLAAVFYTMAWLCATLVAHPNRSYLSHYRAKQVLLFFLLSPPIIAAVITISGATLRHNHHPAGAEHHSIVCGQLFSEEASAHLLSQHPLLFTVMGAILNGAAWLTIGVGCIYLAQLFLATRRLERGLKPLLEQPSPRLEEALIRVGQKIRVPMQRFYECPVPPTFSSVIGLWHPRCVLSKILIATASDSELDAVIAHESVHLNAIDVVATFLIGILNSLFFYLRPVRLLSLRWREETELACDAAAVAATREPLAMAAAILRVHGMPIEKQQKTLPSVTLAFADEAACLTTRRVESLLEKAERKAAIPESDSQFHVVGGWLATIVLAGLGGSLLLSAQLVCYFHCSLEAVARLLP